MDIIENVIMNYPKWMKNMWRGNKFEPKVLRYCREIGGNELCIAGDESVRDQLGPYAWCMALKGSDEPFLRAQGPVDGHRHHMRALRAESTHVLAGIALISRLEQFMTTSMKTVPVYTDCQTLIKRVSTDNINSPSLFMADHIGLIHQIQQLIRKSEINFEIEYAQTIKNDEFDMTAWNEKLVQLMHVDAYNYYTTKEAITPRKYTDYLHGLGISLVANNKPIVSDIGMSIQTLERRAMREDYIRDRLNIHASMIENVDMYTLGRVMSKTHTRQCIYSKIIYKELNTMSVNQKWSVSIDKCPGCLNVREDWINPLVCQHKDLIRKRDDLLIEFEDRLTQFKTYHPLKYFILNFFRNLYQTRVPNLLQQQTHNILLNSMMHMKIRKNWDEKIFAEELYLGIGGSYNIATY